jgi:hypothetical protein
MNLKKILVFGGIGLAVVGGGGFGAMKFLGKGNHEEHEEAPEGAEGASHEREAPKPAAHSAPPPPPPPAAENYAAEPAESEDTSNDVAVNQTHVINLPGGGGRGGFHRSEICIIVKDPELGKLMASSTPTPEREKAKAIVFEALGELPAEDLLDHDTQMAFRQDLMDRLNEEFRPKGPPPPPEKGKTPPPPRPRKPIRDVLIVSWALQR